MVGLAAEVKRDRHIDYRGDYFTAPFRSDSSFVILAILLRALIQNISS